MSSEPPSKSDDPPPRRARTRQRLIEAALAAISEKGFFRTTIDEIAAKAGLTKGAVYDNFKSKDELLLAFATAYPRVFEWPTERSGSVKDRLRRLGKAVIEQHQKASSATIGQAEFLLYALTHPEIKTGMAALMMDQLAKTEGWVREMFMADELPLPQRQFAMLIETLMPSLMYTRALSASYISEDDVLAMFESLAGEG